MKNIILLVAMLLGWYSYATAQRQFTISIMDAAQITAINESEGQVYPVFSNESINQVFEHYELYKFELAYPAARLASTRRVWLIECNEIQLMYDLMEMEETIFLDGEEVPEGELTYSPNDYGLTTQVSGQKDLDLIRAKDAWDITTGNPNVIIGISDTYFNITHEDLINKIDTVRNNVFNPNDPNEYHGTLTAGAAGAETDNNKGISSIGFNCKLDLSDRWSFSGHNEFLQMSKDRVRVVNGSWYTSCNYALSLKRIYDEVYENGTIACFGAGNGFNVGKDGNGIRRLTRNHCDWGPTYPAACPHNISVSSVGCDVNYGQKSWWPGLTDSIKWNWKDIHENVVQKYDTIDVGGSGSGSSTYYPAGSVFQTEVHNHNSTVDIVAPGYTVRTTTMDGNYYSVNGTSFASPLVAGTCGLMLSAKSCLTPYQLEYGLKTTAVNIYTIPENQPYVGQLGAGRLDAGSAVSWASNHDCNSIYTTTMYIKGIDVNTICRPGMSSNSVNPILTPIIENGTAPFTYVWEALTGNQSTLDAYNIATPEVIASSGTHQLKYYLTVYDNSPIQKVASKQIEIQLSSSNTYDLAMRDSYMDMANEPNDQISLDPREWNIWQSPDVWNRQAQDSVGSHENPEYFTTNPNYVYARVRNIGCADSPSDDMRLRLYWTKSSTGEDWDADWTTTNVIGTGGLSVPGGREITASPNAPIAIPVLAPGDEFVTNLPWYPIAPEEYDPSLSSVDVCFLARITEDNTAPYGMAFSEVVLAKTNILNNNNIVTRNFSVTNFRPGNFRDRRQVFVGNAEAEKCSFDLQIINERTINPHFSGDMSAAGSVIVHLGSLYDRWVSNGSEGTYADIDEENRTVTFDGIEPLLLKNIDFQAYERVSIMLDFDGDQEYVHEIPFTVHLRQFVNDEVYETPYGNVTFEIEPNASKSLKKEKEKVVAASDNYTLYPNPTSEILKLQYIGNNPKNKVSLRVLDINGRVLLEMNNMTLNSSETREINVKDYPQGIYILQFIDNKGYKEQLKFVKK